MSHVSSPMEHPGSIHVVSHTSYCGRVQSSLCGVCIGLLLFLVSFPALYYNEASSHASIIALDDLNTAVSKGGVVHIVGAVQPCELQDPHWGVSSPALRMTRSVEYRQVVERSSSSSKGDGRGGTVTETTYSYDTVWSPSRVDSGAFHDVSRRGVNEKRATGAGHTSPGHNAADVSTWDVDGKEWTCYPAYVNPDDGSPRVRLPHELVQSLGSEAPVPLTSAAHSEWAKLADGGAAGKALTAADPLLAQTLAAVTVRDNMMYLGDPVSPRIGDVRFKYNAANPSSASILAVMSGRKEVTPFVASNGVSLLLAEEGRQTPQALIASRAAADSVRTWAFRALGWLLMFVALVMIMGPLSVLPDAIPWIGPTISSLTGCGTCMIAFTVSAACSIITIAVSWIATRPMLSLTLLAVGVGLFMVSRSLWPRSKVNVEKPKTQ